MNSAFHQFIIIFLVLVLIIHLPRYLKTCIKSISPFSVSLILSHLFLLMFVFSDYLFSHQINLYLKIYWLEAVSMGGFSGTVLCLGLQNSDRLTQLPDSFLYKIIIICLLAAIYLQHNANILLAACVILSFLMVMLSNAGAKIKLYQMIVVILLSLTAMSTYFGFYYLRDILLALFVLTHIKYSNFLTLKDFLKVT